MSNFPFGVPRPREQTVILAYCYGAPLTGTPIPRRFTGSGAKPFIAAMNKGARAGVDYV